MHIHSALALFAAALCISAGSTTFAADSGPQKMPMEQYPKTGAFYFVAPEGADQGPGTLEQPWRTLAKATAAAVAGDTVFLRAGVYRERLVVASSGTPGKPITFAAYPGEAATLDGSNLKVPDWSGFVQIEGQSHVRISGLNVIHAGSTGIRAGKASNIRIDNNRTLDTVSSGIGMWGCRDVILENNEVELACNDGSQECISLDHTVGFEVRNNHVFHGGPGSQGGEGIDAKNGTANGKIHHNHVETTVRLGIYVDAWNSDTHDIEVFANVVHDTGASGLAVAAENGGRLHGVRIYNNLVYRNKGPGLAVAGWGVDGKAHPVDHITIVNNTFYGNGTNWGGGLNMANPEAKSITIRNNIFSQNRSAAIVTKSAHEDLRIENNLTDGAADWGTGTIKGDAMFVAPDKGDFHPRAGSPAIAAGISTDAPATDFEGRPRPVTPTVGAIEPQ